MEVFRKTTNSEGFAGDVEGDVKGGCSDLSARGLLVLYCPEVLMSKLLHQQE